MAKENKKKNGEKGKKIPQEKSTLFRKKSARPRDFLQKPLKVGEKGKKIPQDIVGDIAILKFKRDIPLKKRKALAKEFLAGHKNIITVLEKTSKFSGRLRKQKTSHLAGFKTKKATYRENDCIFRFDIDETYFSPRLSNERKILSEEVIKISKKRGTKILVMCAGVGPFPIVIAKYLKKSGKSAEIFSNEINRKANSYAKGNIILNKVKDYVILIPGDSKKLPQKIKNKLDIIIMARPNIKETFLPIALRLSKKGATIFYHGFGAKEKVLQEIKNNAKNKIGKISMRKAGDIGPYEFRWLAKFKVK